MWTSTRVLRLAFPFFQEGAAAYLLATVLPPKQPFVFSMNKSAEGSGSRPPGQQGGFGGWEVQKQKPRKGKQATAPPEKSHRSGMEDTPLRAQISSRVCSPETARGGSSLCEIGTEL